uniref:VHS domain-containing protein n=1 Tax=uncultured organism MedDCM-OCT-S01-C7 TaxID=743602 RepID=D6PJ07_9ZZZZ|nr:hypothetical protein [uncultured organism MedDCM-OCT-S01-C7]
MIQIWADTFMMHEDQFPYIMANYRLLRKEKVEFPKRDPTEKFMINFDGTESPVYASMEVQSRKPSTTLVDSNKPKN